MALPARILIILLSFILFQGKSEAAISFPSKYGNDTYWLPGSTVTLPWDYDFLESEITSKEWVFVASRSTEKKSLATIGFTSKKDPRVNLTGKATLSFPDAKSTDNGTYTFQLTLTRSRFSSKSVLVIILVAPIAQIQCFGNYKDYYCECKSDVGNPPPHASWHKDGKMIGGFGYKRKNLTVSDISNAGPGIYTCNVTSHNLSSQTNLILNKPTSISFTSNRAKATIGGTVTITCTANVIPPPEYFITFNGSNVNDVVNGVKRFLDVSRENAGKYECVARNIFGNITESLDLEVEEKLPMTTETSKNDTSTKEKLPTTAEPTKNDTTVGTTGEKEKTLELGIILGIVIGGVLFIVLLIVLVCCCCCAETAIFAYFLSKWRCCEYFRCDCCIHISDRDSEEPVVPHHSGSNVGSLPRDDNAYETVDKAKVHKAAEAGPSNGSNPPDGNDSGLPPVYAVVDKKKTKKATQPPAVTYAALDAVALQPDSSKMRNRDREETNYASINLENLQSDLV